MELPNKEDPQICMVTKEYEINKEKIRENFMLPEYKKKEIGFLKHFH
jgi:hypothetical protein